MIKFWVVLSWTAEFWWGFILGWEHLGHQTVKWSNSIPSTLYKDKFKRPWLICKYLRFCRISELSRLTYPTKQSMLLLNFTVSCHFIISFPVQKDLLTKEANVSAHKTLKHDQQILETISVAHFTSSSTFLFPCKWYTSNVCFVSSLEKNLLTFVYSKKCDLAQRFGYNISFACIHVIISLSLGTAYLSLFC